MFKAWHFPSLCGYALSLLLLWEGPSFNSAWKERNMGGWEQNIPHGAAQEGSVGTAQCSWRQLTSCFSSCEACSLSPSLLTGVRVKAVGMVQRAQSSVDEGLSPSPDLPPQLPPPLLPILCPKRVSPLFVPCLGWAWRSVRGPPWFNHIHSTQCYSNEGSPTTAAC